VDPACGSGSFLIGVYNYLLDWYLQKYQGVKKYAKKLSSDGTRLLLQEKKDILTRHIYGVDLDSQAVEVSKLSLLLKLMEDETANDNAGLSFTYLPNLEKNIKAGNSLVGKDYLDDIQVSLFDKKEQHKIKVFNWQDEFPEVFKKGGFDAVVGNPPYGADLGNLVNYCKKKFDSANSDTAVLFMYQMKKLLKQTNGKGSFIIPKPFLYASNWQQIVNNLLPNLTHVIDCGKVWKEVKLEQCIFVYDNSYSLPYYESGVRVQNILETTTQIDKSEVEKFAVILTGISQEELSVGIKLNSFELVLNDVVSNSRGSIIQNIFEENGQYLVWGGAHISRYAINKKDRDIKGKIKKSTLENNKKSIVLENSILAQNIIAHVQNPFPRIVIGAIPSDLVAQNIVIDDTINQLVNTSTYHTYALLGILNSKLVAWYLYRFIFGNAIRTMHFDNPITSRIPFPKLDLTNKKDKALHDDLVSKVQLMLKLQKDTPNPTTKLQIEALDRQIDRLVYQMYRLSDDEIRVVEGER
ncbi:MAG: Eco57I restriction-modification methylase domain-containing protein, partial [Brevinema sp.]